MNIILKVEKLTEENLFNTAVFAALWSITEIYLGAILNVSKVPFRGAIMSLVAILLLVGARSVLSSKGSLVLLGIVTATFKLFLGIGFNVTPFLAIIIESFIAELFLYWFGFSRFAAVLTGVSVMLYSMAHGIIMQAVFLGSDIFKVYYKLIQSFKNYFGIPDSFMILIILLIPIIYVSAGILSGLFGWSVGQNIRRLLKER